ncbi:thyroid receptor-interacting protein 6 isoform 1-T1 [Dugong dugon]
MSGPTWLPPKQPEPSRAPQGRVFPRGPPGPPVAHGAALQPHPRVNFCPLPSEQCYQATGGPEDRGPAWGGSHGAPQHPQGLPPDRGGLCPGSLDAEIDSLTSMLAELDGGRGHMPQRPDQQAYEPLQPPAYRAGSLKPNGGGVPSLQLPASPYRGPTPASYATASTPAGPAFPVQVKVAQPVRGCGPPRWGSSQASRPLLGPHFPLSGRGEVWGAGYRSHREPGPGGKEEAAGVPGPAGGGRGGRYGSQVPLSQPPEEELERLTKKLVHDMNHPPSGEYFGRCGGCGEDVVGDGAGVVALDRVFHVGCFVCSTCRAQLRGQHFYAVERRAYCESCYVATLEKCSMCSQPILDRILRAMGKAYHPGCFTCVVCHRGLDGIPFTVDATSQIHCIEDFHSLLHDAQCAAGPSCLSQVRRRLCELLLWIEVFILAVTSVRSVGCCSPLKVSVKAATHWMGTSCVSPAVPGASRSSQPPSPPIAESSEKHLLHSLLPSTTVPEIHLYHFVTKCCLHLIMK